STAKIALSVGDAAEIAGKLKGMFGDKASTQGVPYIDSDPSTNSILVKGTASQVADVKAAIDVIEGRTSTPGSGAPVFGPNTRIITLDKGSAATLAEEIER